VTNVTKFPEPEPCMCAACEIERIQTNVIEEIDELMTPSLARSVHRDVLSVLGGCRSSAVITLIALGRDPDHDEGHTCLVAREDQSA